MTRDQIAGDYDYESGGAGYAVNRRPDPRIEPLVHAALGQPAPRRAGVGEWDRKYAHLRSQPAYVGAVRLIRALP